MRKPPRRDPSHGRPFSDAPRPASRRRPGAALALFALFGLHPLLPGCHTAPAPVEASRSATAPAEAPYNAAAPADTPPTIPAAPAEAPRVDPAAPAEDTRTAALKAELGPDTTITLHGPFAVVGDITPRELREALSLLDRVDEAMQTQFEMKPLSGRYRLYLWKSEESYGEYCKKAFGEEPISPFGFFTGDQLVMNYRTGGGTLVHELVHAYLDENVKEVPTWFNEGLASLYERSSSGKGEIRGYPNWRLPILQKAIKRKETVPLATLLSLTPAQFQGEGRGLHYAEARYLLYHLQEEGRLPALFKAMRDRRIAEDPVGEEALSALSGEDLESLAAEAWARAMTLKAP
jgi:hypothetical protein